MVRELKHSYWSTKDVDTILKKLPKQMVRERALLKVRSLLPLLYYYVKIMVD